jgi:hypothetical protein
MDVGFSSIIKNVGSFLVFFVFHSLFCRTANGVTLTLFLVTVYTGRFNVFNQDRQSTYNLSLGRVRVTIVALGRQ